MNTAPVIAMPTRVAFPAIATEDRDALIEACFQAAANCTLSAKVCLLDNPGSQLSEGARTDLNCAAICKGTAQALSRFTGSHLRSIRNFGLRTLVAACEKACLRCAEVRERCAADRAELMVSAEECRRCAAACRALLAS